MDSRIDRLKAQLYFPSVEGYRYDLRWRGWFTAAAAPSMAELCKQSRLQAQADHPHPACAYACSVAVGGSGVYIGAKDYLISEVLGGFSATADCGPSAHKDRGKVGRLTLQIGAHASPPPPG